MVKTTFAARAVAGDGGNEMKPSFKDKGVPKCILGTRGELGEDHGLEGHATSWANRRWGPWEGGEDHGLEGHATSCAKRGWGEEHPPALRATPFQGGLCGA